VTLVLRLSELRNMKCWTTISVNSWAVCCPFCKTMSANFL